jgi:hypothetical protein
MTPPAGNSWGVWEPITWSFPFQHSARPPTASWPPVRAAMLYDRSPQRRGHTRYNFQPVDFEAHTVSIFKGDRGRGASATWINDGEKYGLVGLSVSDLLKPGRYSGNKRRSAIMN